jgi:STE24 endopeptidase
MMYNLVFYLILCFIIFDFLLERYLDYLNQRELKTVIPSELEGVYEPEKYKKSQDYERTNIRFSLLTSSFSFLLILLMMFFKGFAYIDSIAASISSNNIIITLLFFGILMFASDILNTPFSLYDTFVIEQHYGFNKTSIRTFFIDKLKGWLLAIIIGGGLLALITWLYLVTNSWFWIYAWIAISVFTIFMTVFYSSLIVPLFNKQRPLPDSELKDALYELSEKTGFQLDKVFVIDGSKRSTKANAYFTGLGAKKRIVLYDTLIKEMTTAEIVAVLAHEIGHYKKKHVYLGLLMSLVEMGITLYLLSLLAGNRMLPEALGSARAGFHLTLVAFAILYSPVSFLLGIFTNIWSRRNEYQADHYASEIASSEDLITALKKLSVNNLSNLTPHPLYVFFYYSHPTILQRILALKK